MEYIKNTEYESAYIDNTITEVLVLDGDLPMFLQFMDCEILGMGPNSGTTWTGAWSVSHRKYQKNSLDNIGWNR